MQLMLTPIMPCILLVIHVHTLEHTVTLTTANELLYVPKVIKV